MPAPTDYTATLTTLRTREATQPQPEGMVVRVIDSRGDRVIPLRGTRLLGGRLSSHPVALDGNLSEAARRMGIDRRTLTKRVEKLGLRDTGDGT